MVLKIFVGFLESVSLLAQVLVGVTLPTSGFSLGTQIVRRFCILFKQFVFLFLFLLLPPPPHPPPPLTSPFLIFYIFIFFFPRIDNQWNLGPVGEKGKNIHNNLSNVGCAEAGSRFSPFMSNVSLTGKEKKSFYREHENILQKKILEYSKNVEN